MDRRWQSCHLLDRINKKIQWLLYGKWRHKFREWKSVHGETFADYAVVKITGHQGVSGKRALICYKLEPFLPNYDPQLAKQHSNHWHSQKIVEILKEFYAAIDVTDYRNRRAPDGREYDLVVGLDSGFMSACRRIKNSSSTKRIYLGTGAHIEQAHEAIKKRLAALKARKGVVVRPRCRVRKDSGPSLASHIFVIGDDWVEETYRVREKAPVFGLPNTVIEGVKSSLCGKDYGTARTNFLWLASYAALSRGLDVLLEVFRELPELQLWVCGSIKHERDFVSAYSAELYNTPNIHFEGWVDVTSDHFTAITRECAYIIYPSASDGMPGSVVNSMAAGLVPVLTKEAGVDAGGFAVMLDECSPENVRQVVNCLSHMDVQELQNRSIGVQSFARSRYAEGAFTEAFRNALDQVLSGLQR